MEHCIVYFSSSVSLFREVDLIALLEQSRSYNAAMNITGILLINRGSIVQVLEGSQDVIEALYQRIEKDTRHTDVKKVVDCSVEKRSFSDWSMDHKFITTHHLELIKSLVELGELDWIKHKPSTNVIINMLKSVYRK